ncbi:hypothetical protein COU74_00015 [Candidatus Peregrinibacteria bacterium CG10_big_fil_rev_8_21_14_0_10_36_19]|nr:MAG: hypothetical protein COU74_00015 [Candidatus Peregrinibacteria bacterium CG10_big_fil_rev_8_21_14_0_10_36_19]
MSILSLLSNLQFLWFLLGATSVTLAYFFWFYKKERRLFKNLKRPVAIIVSDIDNMSHEAELLKSIKFFDVRLLQDPQRSIDIIDDRYRLVILRYKKDSESFWKTFNSLSGRQFPVIVFSKPGEIDREDVRKIQGYSLHTLCNAPLRLISDVFAIMSTYPEDKKI